MAHATHILSVGYDPILLPLRSLVLRSRGYVVEEAYSLAKAFHGVHSDAIDLLLICHTVPAHDQSKLIESVRSVRRLLPILCITNREFAHPTNDCVTVTNSPLELLDAVLVAAGQRESILSFESQVDPAETPRGTRFKRQ